MDTYVSQGDHLMKCLMKKKSVYFSDLSVCISHFNARFNVCNISFLLYQCLVEFIEDETICFFQCKFIMFV